MLFEFYLYYAVEQTKMQRLDVPTNWFSVADLLH
jgi:hypothetical protein